MKKMNALWLGIALATGLAVATPASANVAAITAVASTSAEQQEQQLLTAELIWQLKRLGSPEISPNGRHIVVPVTEYDMDTNRSSTQLWLFAADGSSKRPLTAAGMRASNPVFSPDGNQLAFISQRDKDDAGQVYVLPMDGPGEAVGITSVPTGVSSLLWAGNHIYFSSSIWPGKSWEAMKEQQSANRASHVSAMKWHSMPYASFDRYLDEARETHIFRVSPQGGEVERITEKFGLALASNYDVSPDGRYIAFTANSEPESVVPNIDLFLARIGSDTAENISEGNKAPDANPKFSPDGKTLAYTRQRIQGFYADQTNLVLRDLSNGSEREITTDFDRSIGAYVWMPNGRGFYATIDDAGTSRVYSINARNGRAQPLTGATNHGNIAISSTGTLVGTNESFLHPARLVTINTRNGNTTRLDSFNDDLLANVDLGTYESVTYQGYNGQDIQMWVHYPPGFDSSKKYPLFLLIHGGPHNAITDGFHYRWNAQTFSSWGYVTAWHNFHGSSGFGQEFTDSINPDWVTAPYADTIAAAEWFMEKDWIDNERMVAGGASYGGYLSSILLGKPHPFNALLIHAPVYNMYSQMSADFAVHADRFGGFWENPEIYKHISPHYRAGDFNTPALVTHGQTDLRVPVGQGFEIFRTLQTKGIDSRMIYFPDENHWILQPNNSVYWYNEVRDWFSNYAEPGAK